MYNFSIMLYTKTFHTHTNAHKHICTHIKLWVEIVLVACWLHTKTPISDRHTKNAQNIFPTTEMCLRHQSIDVHISHKHFLLLETYLGLMCFACVKWSNTHKMCKVNGFTHTHTLNTIVRSNLVMEQNYMMRKMAPTLKWFKKWTFLLDAFVRVIQTWIFLHEAHTKRVSKMEMCLKRRLKVTKNVT